MATNRIFLKFHPGSHNLKNRGYFMTAEIQNLSSSIEKCFTHSLHSLMKCFSTQEENFRISKRPCNILLLYKHQWDTKSFHEGHQKVRTSYVTMATVIFSRMNICFRMKVHLYFIGVYVTNYRFINNFCLCYRPSWSLVMRPSCLLTSLWQICK